MKSHARVVVIGGGIGGCSTLYHLTQEGWSDVVLVERDELTSGSTWHAAAQVTQFGANQTMVHGACEWDAWFLDPRRFTRYANTEHTALKAVEDYRHEFHYHMPDEDRPAARLARTTPLYPVLDQLGCAWGTVNGWERARFFKPDPGFVHEHSYRFTPTKDVVAAEVATVTQGVGLMEVSGFNRYEIPGPGAAAEWHDRDWLRRHMPEEGVSLVEMAASHTTLVVAGPKSRALLQSVSPRCDWSAAAFPWMRAQTMFIGYAEVMVMSVSFSGELAYELHVPNEQLYLAWQTLDEAGEAFGLGHFGLYATESIRLEKGYRHWKADLIYECNPIESGLDGFVRLEKADFLGKEALVADIARGPRRRFVTLTVDCAVAPARGGDPVYLHDRVLGTVTSGGYGHRVNKNIALAFVDPEFAVEGTELSVRILGERYDALVAAPCLYDPENTRVSPRKPTRR